MAELEALSKLKMAGRLRFWRGTIEIDERELHAICDEIQAEHDKAVAAMNSAAGKWAKADAELRKAIDFMRIWISDDAHLGESELSYELEKSEGLRNLEAIEQAIAATLGSGACSVESKIFIDGDYVPTPYYEYEMGCGGVFRWDEAEAPNCCPNCGRRVQHERD